MWGLEGVSVGAERLIVLEGLAIGITTMSLLHLSISASDPEAVACFLAQLLAGEAMLFPPFPGCWIAFSGKDDGTAIEVYPDTQVLVPGDGAVECRSASPNNAKAFVHAAIASPLPADDIIALGRRQGWISRLCDRGPFQCIEIWLENRLLIEVLDPEMLADYRAGMTTRNWVEMFGPEVRPG
jgi:hypothetical protein